MVAVLPLAALATFETVPGVPLRWPGPWPCGPRPIGCFALEAVAIPVTDPAVTPDGARRQARRHLRRARLRYATRPPRALDGIDLAWRRGTPWRSPVRAGPASRVWSTRCCASGRSSGHAHRRRHRRGAAAPGRRARPPARWPTSARSSSPVQCGPTSPLVGPMPMTRPSTTALGRPSSTASWPPCRPVSTRPSATTASQLSGGERRRLAVARALLAPVRAPARRADQRARQRVGRRRSRRCAGIGSAMTAAACW